MNCFKKVVLFLRFMVFLLAQRTFPNENNNDGKKINNNKTITCKSFEYKAKIRESAPINNTVLNQLYFSIKVLDYFLEIS